MTAFTHVGRAVAELERIGFGGGLSADDKALIDLAYAALRVGVLARNGLDLSEPFSTRIKKTKDPAPDLGQRIEEPLRRIRDMLKKEGGRKAAGG
jgi:hypothetical protein